MSQSVALKGHYHTCPQVDPGPTPHIGGPISGCQQSFVTYNGRPLALVGDTLTCEGSHAQDTIVSGSACVTINGIPVARQGDRTAHGGVIVEGEAGLTLD
ncbi:PAAR domain-containing protein [Serratia microhaemolytica]|uniref:PAAR domain-containing protein n=1 Tax=Serratia microhaemolytica TaxID=2675110 RepID=UPI000FDCEE73|nr:PAAR domain-containing protein [Serratia microhaemolytica]